MRERPIIFNSENVEAILEGRKTQTRRVMKPQPVRGRPWKDWIIDPEVIDLPVAYCPYGIARDRLWVRETWAVISFGVQRTCGVAYRADGELAPDTMLHWRRVPVDKWPAARMKLGGRKWRSPIHMPRWVSRLTLEIVDVRIERVQEITADDARAEGVPAPKSKLGMKFPDMYACWRFAYMWDAINGKRGFGWEVNPWVWVIEFPRYEGDSSLCSE